MELTQHTNGNVSNEGRDTLYLMGGAALVVFGVGLILSTPFMRKLLGEVNIGNLMGSAVPGTCSAI